MLYSVSIDRLFIVYSPTNTRFFVSSLLLLYKFLPNVEIAVALLYRFLHPPIVLDVPSPSASIFL